MNLDWSSRIGSTQLLLLYPILSANKIYSEADWSIYFTVGSIALIGILLNYIFIKDLLCIFKSKLPIQALYKEYLWVLAIALMNISLFASIYHIFGMNYNGGVIKGDWYHSFYFSVVTWTTLGYGDFSPVESLRLLAAFEAMVGYFYMAILVGLLLNLSQHSIEPEIVED